MNEYLKKYMAKHLAITQSISYRKLTGHMRTTRGLFNKEVMVFGVLKVVNNCVSLVSPIIFGVSRLNLSNECLGLQCVMN